MHDAASANAGVGTVGIWNFGAEECTYDTLWVRANVAVVLTSVNDGVNQPGPFTLTSYQSLATSHSLGVTTFDGECFLNGLQKRNAPVIIQNITSIDFQNTYIADTSGGAGSQKAAIYFMGNCNNIRFKGLIEVLSSIQFDGFVANGDFRITWGGVDGTSNGILLVNRLKANSLQNCWFTLDVESNFTRPVLTTVDGNESSTSSYSLINTTIYSFNANGSAANLYMPANVAANAGTFFNKLVGQANKYSQLAFAVAPALDATNATGGGVTYSLNAAAVNVDFDTAAAVGSGTGIFTAPLAGYYRFVGRISLSGVVSGHTDGQLFLNANSQQYQLARTSPIGGQVPSQEIVYEGSETVFLSSGQTAYLQIKVTGGSTVITVSSGGTSTNWRTRFSGSMLY
jgi:hypothetical protein